MTLGETKRHWYRKGIRFGTLTRRADGALGYVAGSRDSRA